MLISGLFWGGGGEEGRETEVGSLIVSSLPAHSVSCSVGDSDDTMIEGFERLHCKNIFERMFVH